MPARTNAFLHALVLGCKIGRPSNVNTTVWFRPICSRTTASASLFSGTGIAFPPFAWSA